MKIFVFHTPEIDEKSESVSGIKVYRIHRAVFLSKSFKDLFPNISCLHSLAVNLIWDSIDNHLHFSDVGIECLLTVSRTSGIWLVKKKKSLHWLLGTLMLSLMIVSDPLSTEIVLRWDVFVHESLPICVSASSTVNDFILKLDVSQFIGELCHVRSYHNIELEKKVIRKSSWEEDSMILQNLVIQWNPIFVLINIVEFILLVNSWLLLIFSIASNLRNSTDWMPSLNMLALS